ncbi:MAG: hypothetical protein KDD69_17930 [Bdellovibrionales bacterium]|nr:hypothetical protein [Bdellovibrionales bacterium]
MISQLLSVDDLPDSAVDALLERADEFRQGSTARRRVQNAALLFFEPSLRTRTGFLAAAQRLGWPSPVEVLERRSSEISMPESIADTVAVLTSYFEMLIVRVDKPIDTIATQVPSSVGLVNGGDRGDRAEHPTQALIDFFAMRLLVGDVATMKVALCGDMRMRSARSLLKLLARRQPAELVVVTDPALMPGLELPPDITCRVTDSLDGLDNIDALHAVGVPHLAVPEATRQRLRVDASALGVLSPRGLVFSPMPVIDEVAQNVRSDARMAFLQQSALALPMRMAVLDSL